MMCQYEKRLKKGHSKVKSTSKVILPNTNQGVDRVVLLQNRKMFVPDYSKYVQHKD